MILGFRAVRGKKIMLSVLDAGGMNKRKSLLCDENAFTVERSVSFGGRNDVEDDDSRKTLLESMIRECVANFGMKIDFRSNGLSDLVYHEPQEVRWKKRK